MLNIPQKNLTTLYQSLGNLDYDFRNRNLNLLISSLLQGENVLDIGCGVGHFLNLAKNKGFRVIGIEPNSQLIRLSKKIYGEEMVMKEGSIDEINKLPDVFDNITVIDVLEHLKDDEAALAKIRSKLSPKGRLIIVVPAYQFLFGVRDQKIGHCRRYSVTDITSKVRKANLEIEELRHWNALGLLPYIIYEKIFRREVSTALRENKRKNIIERLLISLLDFWLKFVERKINLGFGLSIICVAKLRTI